VKICIYDNIRHVFEYSKILIFCLTVSFDLIQVRLAKTGLNETKKAGMAGMATLGKLRVCGWTCKQAMPEYKPVVW
jgi:hypothetical protein